MVDKKGCCICMCELWQCLLMIIKKKSDIQMNTGLLNFVPKTGVEPARLSTHAPETCASTNSATWANMERKTRLELATPTLARLCSTN